MNIFINICLIFLRKPSEDATSSTFRMAAGDTSGGCLTVIPHSQTLLDQHTSCVKPSIPARGPGHPPSESQDHRGHRVQLQEQGRQGVHHGTSFFSCE